MAIHAGGFADVPRRPGAAAARRAASSSTQTAGAAGSPAASDGAQCRPAASVPLGFDGHRPGGRLRVDMIRVRTSTGGHSVRQVKLQPTHWQAGRWTLIMSSAGLNFLTQPLTAATGKNLEFRRSGQS